MSLRLSPPRGGGLSVYILPCFFEVSIDKNHISDIQNFTLQNGKNENTNVVLMKDHKKLADYWRKEIKNNELIRIIIEVPGESYWHNIIFFIFTLVLNTYLILCFSFPQNEHLFLLLFHFQVTEKMTNS